jgi:hypothetical protein
MAKLRILYRLSTRSQEHVFLKLTVFLDSLFGNPGDYLGGAWLGIQPLPIRSHDPARRWREGKEQDGILL